MALEVSERYLERYGHIICLLAAFALTAATAAASYHFFEARFLRLKERFEVVRSRPIGA